MSERSEIFMRIIVLIVCCIVLGVWKALIQIMTVVHWFVVLFTGKRNKDFANWSMIWTSQMFRFYKYMTFGTNVRPFPFTSLSKNIEPVDMKK
jgi:hypothetical protein